MSSDKAGNDLADLIYERGSYDEFVFLTDRIDHFLSRNIVIPKADLPEVTLCGCSTHGLSMKGDCWGEAEANTPVGTARETALEYIAHWQYVEARAAAARTAEVAAKEVARNKRRDDLASEFTAVDSYNGQLPYTQKLIDRIIDLEQAAS